MAEQSAEFTVLAALITGGASGIGITTGRRVTAEEVAAAIAYLASPYAGAATPTALAVDGRMAVLRVMPASAASQRIR